MSQYLTIQDENQGLTTSYDPRCVYDRGSVRDVTFGYCGITDRGGQFFSWFPTLAETLASIRDDETDSPRDWPRRAYQEVRGQIRRWWASGYRGR